MDTPDIRDVTVEAGQPLTFTASFDTLPPFEPGEYATISLRRPSSAVSDEALDQAMQRLRERAARFEPVEGRGVDHGDTVTLDLERTDPSGATGHATPTSTWSWARRRIRPASTSSCWASMSARPRASRIHYPADYAVTELAGTDVSYTVTVKGIKRRRLPELDDEFAKDLGEFETLDALRARVRDDLAHEAGHAADRDVRAQLMKALAARVPFELPASLVERELDRRVEEFAHRLLEQKINPNEAGIDWRAFRESQREAASEAVGAALVIDEVARREQLDAERRGGRARGRAVCRSGWAARWRRCAPSSKRSAGCRGCAPVCGGKRRLTSSSPVLLLHETRKPFPARHLPQPVSDSQYA